MVNSAKNKAKSSLSKNTSNTSIFFKNTIAFLLLNRSCNFSRVTKSFFKQSLSLQLIGWFFSFLSTSPVKKKIPNLLSSSLKIVWSLTDRGFFSWFLCSSIQSRPKSMVTKLYMGSL